MNAFREKVLGSGRGERTLLRVKQRSPRPSVIGEPGSLAMVGVPREAFRQFNQRKSDRHWVGDAADVVQVGSDHQCKLVNLSMGGAMIECDAPLQLWDQVELQVGSGRVEAVVRWVRGERYGLEFAHDAAIEATDEWLSQTLRHAVEQSFLSTRHSVRGELGHSPAEARADGQSATHANRQDQPLVARSARRPVDQSGVIHYNYDTSPIRVRNISATGAMIESDAKLRVSAELLLDLGSAGAVFASVTWAEDGHAGLHFLEPYDAKKL